MFHRQGVSLTCCMATRGSQCHIIISYVSEVETHCLQQLRPSEDSISTVSLSWFVSKNAYILRANVSIINVTAREGARELTVYPKQRIRCHVSCFSLSAMRLRPPWASSHVPPGTRSVVLFSTGQLEKKIILGSAVSVASLVRGIAVLSRWRLAFYLFWVSE